VVGAERGQKTRKPQHGGFPAAVLCLTVGRVQNLQTAQYLTRHFILLHQTSVAAYAIKDITVYLRWPERDLLALSPLVRHLWGSLIDELISTYDRRQGSGCNPVLLLVDEAGRTSIPMLADQATTVVGRKIYLWISVQSLSQLETVYGRARVSWTRFSWTRNWLNRGVRGEPKHDRHD
jgi:type IV secretory pathway TraG/TraD family ATPase VirD4